MDKMSSNMLRTPRKTYGGKPVMTPEERWQRQLGYMRNYSKKPHAVKNNIRRNRDAYYAKTGRTPPTEMERKIKKLNAKKMLTLYKKRARNARE
jgi:hypothetical protein